MPLDVKAQAMLDTVNARINELDGFKTNLDAAVTQFQGFNELYGVEVVNGLKAALAPHRDLLVGIQRTLIDADQD